MSYEIYQEITIELDGQSPFDYVVVKQGDKGSRILSVNLLENKKIYAIPAGCTARVKYYKPDGNPVLNDATISGNKILVTYTEQMLAAAGTAKGEILILKGTQELKSATYFTKIVPTVYETDGLISDKEFLSLATQLVKLDQASDKANAQANIATAAATNANAKADLANAEATNANAKADLADAAATNANAKANLADAAATNANAKANLADAAATNANAKADLANVAAAGADIAKGNASTAAQAANAAAAGANDAKTAANAAAAACTGIAAGINTIPDTVTGYTYTIGIENGKMYLERTGA